MIHQKTIMSGYLLKSRGRRGWHRRWVVLRNNQLVTYKDESEYEPLRVINLSDVISIIELSRDNRENVLAIFTSNKVIYFQAFSRDSLKSWTSAIFSCSPLSSRHRFNSRRVSMIGSSV